MEKRKNTVAEEWITALALFMAAVGVMYVLIEMGSTTV